MEAQGEYSPGSIDPSYRIFLKYIRAIPLISITLI